MDKFFPYSKPCLDQDDINGALAVLKSDWLTTGPMVEKFEQAIANEVNSNYAIACSNGTAALHLAMMALDVQVGDTVLVPAITFLASANAARFVGADVAWVDVSPETGLITEQTLLEAIGRNKDKKIKALVNVHFAGQCQNLEVIYRIAKEYDLLIIEDASHAIGTEYINQDGGKVNIGSNQYCNLTTFSFHAVKTVSAAEGGAITTNDSRLAAKLKLLRCHGMVHKRDIAPWYYEMHEIGYNYRMTDLQCALGYSQLKKLQAFKVQHQRLSDIYNEVFSGHSFIKGLQALAHCSPCWHLYVMLCDYSKLFIDKIELVNALKEKGIGTQIHYIPLHNQPYYQERYGKQSLRGAEKYYQSTLSLPMYASLSEEACYYIATTVAELVR